MSTEELDQRNAAESADEQSAADGEVEALEFELGDQRYCVDIGYVAEIVNCDEPTPIPNSPPHIEGVVALREEAIKVVNLHELFDVGEGYDDTKLIVFKRKDGADSRLGWLVDSVVGVTTFSESAVEAASSEAGIRGVVQRSDRFLVWFDPARVRI